MRDGRLYCTATDMDFSIVLSKELTNLVANAPAAGVPSKVKWGGTWRCPADGTYMTEVDGIVACQACKRSLPPRLLYGLVEFHNHF